MNFNRKTGNKLIALFLLASMLAAALWFFFFRQDEGSVIRSRMKEAAAQVSRQPAGSGFNLQSAGAASSIGDFFMEKAEVGVSRSFGHDGYDIAASTRAQIVSSYFLLRPQAASLELELSEIEVSFTDDAHRVANVKCTALLTGSTKSGDSIREARQISAELVRENDGVWRFRTLHADFIIGIV